MTPRVLVTGASGRIGRVVVPLLRERFDVVAAGRRASDGIDAELDLADAASIRLAVAAARPDVVLNLGGVVGAASAVDAALTERVNVGGAVALAEEAREAGASLFVQASTAAVYGTDVDGLLDEDTPLGGRGQYAESKRAAEVGVASASRPGFTTVSARIFNVWGDAFPDSLVTRLAHSRTEGTVELHGWSRFVRDYIHVDDVASAIAAIVAADPGVLPGALNVASGEGTSNEALVALLREAGMQPAYRVTGDAASWSRADVARLRRLGVSPSSLARHPLFAAGSSGSALA